MEEVPKSNADAAIRLVAGVKDRLAYYEKAARRAQKFSLWLRLVETAIAGALPVLALSTLPRTALAGMAGVLTLLVTTSQMWQFDAKWRQYRLLAEQLRRELFAFELGTGEYAVIAQNARVPVFADRCNDVFEGEMSKWFVLPEEKTS